MIDVGGHALVLDVVPADVAPWLRPVVHAGRDAAFVDTGYIHALLNDRDPLHGTVRSFHEGLSARLYTSALVVAEAARQLAKAKGATQDWRWNRVEALAGLFLDERRMVICAPPPDVIQDALKELCAMQRDVGGALDLVDLVSFLALDGLGHRRVLGFDNHFRAVGAALEP